MIEWEATGDGLRILDHADVELRIDVPGLRLLEADGDLPRPTDETLTALVSELELPAAFVGIGASGEEDGREFGSETGPVELPPDEYLLNVETPIKAYVRFEGAATLRKSPDFETLYVTFPERTRVVLGFRSLHEYPSGTITVSPTPEGVATALSYLHSSLKTSSPDRSFPTLRGHPPRVEPGDRVRVPDAIEAATAETGIRLRAPADLRSLYVLAPLAHYLQAEVTVGDGRPVLEAPATGLQRPLPRVPELQRETATLLRRIFYLDCLVRNAGPHSYDLAEADRLSELPLDPERAYEASPADRLATYLSVSPEQVDPHLPEWPLSTYVQPDPEHVRCLPFLLQKLSLVYLPETSELDGAELIRRSLDDFFRGSPARDGPAGSRSEEPVASVDVLKPELRAGRVHGWLADGVPIDVFKATYEAFDNRLDYLGEVGDGIHVAVVLNEPEMETEYAEVAAIYRERARDLPIEVTVHEDLARDALADVFEAPNDFVHYIGHCEASGLRCPDGNLSLSSIDESNTQTFFLNACGSYHEGMTLIERGSVAGAVTFRKVLDKQAATVGTTFARLLVHGFSFARAMRLARRRIMTGKDYAVIGDGTHALTQAKNSIPLELHLEADDEGFRLTAHQYAPGMTGAIYQLTVEDRQARFHLCGNSSTYRFDRDELVEFLDRTSCPVLYDGRFNWSTELAEDL